MIQNEKKVREEAVLDAAHAMMAAARTAPKGKGRDNLEIITVSGDDLHVLAEQMRRYAEQSGMAFFTRDAGNVEQAQAVVIIGTSYGTFGLNCGFCGFATCEAKDESNGSIPCAINSTDLGIAVGSAVSVAADRRLDNRIMYSVGHAALELGWLHGCRAAFGIVLSCMGKNPFFDRVVQK
ncbi:MAG: DUF2148 domain-containing protein [Rikenellaceae bacterium]|nr:DUF2148 domain-containing protein [Rikenellaceae bacterium]MCL2692347.1 DUF2148 domain-containing protein [Rikenellaceae bacterium]